MTALKYWQRNWSFYVGITLYSKLTKYWPKSCIKLLKFVVLTCCIDSWRIKILLQGEKYKIMKAFVLTSHWKHCAYKIMARGVLCKVLSVVEVIENSVQDWKETMFLCWEHDIFIHVCFCYLSVCSSVLSFYKGDIAILLV